MKKSNDDHASAAPLVAFSSLQSACVRPSQPSDPSDPSDPYKRYTRERRIDADADADVDGGGDWSPQVVISHSQAARLVVSSALLLAILLALAFHFGRQSSSRQLLRLNAGGHNFPSGFPNSVRNGLNALTISVNSSRRRILVSDGESISTSAGSLPAVANESQPSAARTDGDASPTDTSAVKDSEEIEFWDANAADEKDAQASNLSAQGSNLIKKLTDGGSEGVDGSGSGDSSEGYYTADGVERLQDPCGGIGGSISYKRGSYNRRCYNRCHRRTKSGYCVKELLTLYDDAYSPLWPARVDLLIRSYVSDNFFLIAFLFASIEQMWPAGIGDVILVLDENDRHVEDIVPTWVKVYYEKNYLDLPGKILQQWSYLWADNYTTAPYIAIIDDDVIFNLKVTPGLLFNLTNGKPYVIGSKQLQNHHWKPSSWYFVHHYFANFMVQLPFVFPRSVLPRFRQHTARRHKKSFDAAVKNYAEHGPSFEKTQIAHTTLGNYMWFFANDSVHWALEWKQDVTPIPRVGVHVPYTQKFRDATLNNSAPEYRLVKAYVDVTGWYAHEAMCHAFPKGELRNCDDVMRWPQTHIWRYVMDWNDWPMIRKHIRGGTVLYDRYKWELQCMYNRVVVARTQEWTDRVQEKRKVFVEELRRSCVVNNSIV
ncbi:hypothetical protein CLOP_g9219 [Closterium sp. NIES-67]|nr:hypothetical protein CLOP_g9219 [Closterium sp. NIES-67]